MQSHILIECHDKHVGDAAYKDPNANRSRTVFNSMFISVMIELLDSFIIGMSRRVCIRAQISISTFSL